MTADDRLSVFFEERLVGHLHLASGDRFRFVYDPAWLSAADCFAISASLPLVEAEHGADAAHWFFANLLPEGDVRRLVARRYGISEGNDFELLRAIGGECAGALVLGDDRPGAPGLALVSPRELAALAREGGALSRTVGTEGVRLSLAGAQDKIPVRIESDQVFVPHGSSASTHILKFPNARFAHMPANEAFMMSLARHLGLPTCDSRILLVEREQLLVVTRYDRLSRAGTIVRLHQEDMCQALGLPPHRKYEREGGPGFADCVEVISRVSAEPVTDTLALIRWLALCVLGFNADGHAKNLSLLRTEDGRWRLAPFYDLLCTGIYDAVDRNLAMRIGESTIPGQIRRQDWQALAQRSQLGARYMLDQVGELAGTIEATARRCAEEFRDAYGDSPGLQRILPVIRKQARRTRELLNE